MKFSEQWLRELVNPAIDTDTLLEQLTMAGLEVDGIEPAAADFNQVVVGEVVDLQPHPDADKLRVASVDIGADTPVQIVCGAANVRIGLKAPTALVGAVLPGDFKIKKSKLRGVESLGMLCSTQELGLDTDADGLMELPTDLPTGQDIREALALDDNIIEVDLTPNRGDCLSITGVAREVGVINRLDVTHVPTAEISESSNKTVAVQIENSEACPVYLGRVIENINPHAHTPMWMQEKLRRGGVRSLGPLVDVTNYVMLELGQPMHAFDLAQIDGKITVRNAKAGETLTLLDDKALELSEETLLIADNSKALALAGVMGGAASGISETSTNLFLECAFFAPVPLAGVARRYGLHTDASHRYERGVDTQLPAKAMARATELLLAIVGGEAGPVTEANHLSQKTDTITLHATSIERLLGIHFADEEVVEILERLGMQTETLGAGQWQVTPPSFRFDIAIEADLIEELGRIYGYNQIPSSAISVPAHLPAHNESHRELTAIKQFFIARDYQEAISYTFVHPDTQAILGLAEGAQNLANPISNDLSQMRTSLWSGLLPAVAYNTKRQHKRIRLFEAGLKFYNDEKQQLQQVPSLAGVICGERTPTHWSEKTETVDFFDLKQDVVALLGDTVDFVASEAPALHPKQTAAIMQKGMPCGILGKIHPQVAEKLEVPSNTYLFELDLHIAEQALVPQFTSLSKFPEVKRDLALMVPDCTPSIDIVRTIKELNGTFVSDAYVFDLYQGDNIAENQHSLALSISFQHQERTLTDQEVETSMVTIVAALAEKYHAKLRD